MADVVSTNYNFKDSLFFPVAYWKVKVMRANVIPTAFIYELEKEPGPMKDRIWWYHGNDIQGETVWGMPTRHRGQIIPQDVLKTERELWVKGLESLVTKLLAM